MVNTAYLMESQNLILCHLGDLNVMPSSGQFEELRKAQVLLVPAGGVCTLGPQQMAEVVCLIDPRLVIPMHYKVEDLKVELGPVAPLLKELGVREPAPQSKLNVTPSNLTSEMRVAMFSRSS